MFVCRFIRVNCLYFGYCTSLKMCMLDLAHGTCNCLLFYSDSKYFIYYCKLNLFAFLVLLKHFLVLQTNIPLFFLKFLLLKVPVNQKLGTACVLLHLVFSWVRFRPSIYNASSNSTICVLWNLIICIYKISFYSSVII